MLEPLPVASGRCAAYHSTRSFTRNESRSQEWPERLESIAQSADSRHLRGKAFASQPRSDAEPNDPHAMALASADASGLPDVRMVLLNARDARGFCFFTNFGSDKGRQLLANPQAAAVFHWKSLRRQVRLSCRRPIPGIPLDTLLDMPRHPHHFPLISSNHQA